MFHFEVFEWVEPQRKVGNTRGRIAKYEPSEREIQMRDLYLAGKTLQEIGDCQNPIISRERVRQLLKKYFLITRKDGGCFVKTTPKKINKAIQLKKAADAIKESRYLKHFYCNEIQFLAINGMHWSQANRKTHPKSPANIYFLQKTNADTRGIQWNISLPDWYKFWQDSGHWHERGKGKGYCMTRIGDTGGYELGNIEIKTIGQNFSESYYKHPWKERFKDSHAKQKA